MSPSLRKSTDEDRPALSTISISRIYDQVAQACSYAGLRSFDAEDLAQDIFLWLLRTDSADLAEETPWLSAVAQNFIKRYWRRSYHRRLQEVSLNLVPELRSRQPKPRDESNEILDRIAAVLPKRERDLLALIRSGRTLAEASRTLKIPIGSRRYYGGRLVRCARRELRRR
jgi:DNA-directed RNA polymerase specialized sigma24 family protein